MQHNVRRCNQVGLLTAGGGEGNSRAELHHASGKHQITYCDSDRCGQQTMQAIQGMATCANEINKHCVAIPAQLADIKRALKIDLLTRCANILLIR